MKSGGPMIKTMEKPRTFMSSSLHKVCQYYVKEKWGPDDKKHGKTMDYINENHGKTMGIREFIE
jgi:hypothetical protein